MDFNSFSYFEKGSPKDHSYEVSMESGYWLRRSRLLKQKLTDGRRTESDHNSSPCEPSALR
jgi:hypothetical protein